MIGRRPSWRNHNKASQDDPIYKTGFQLSSPSMSTMSKQSMTNSQPSTVGAKATITPSTKDNSLEVKTGGVDTLTPPANNEGGE